MRTIIAGTRTFSDYNLFRVKILDIFCEYLLREEELKITEVVSGGAPGADKLGMKYAAEQKIPCILFPAKWNKYGPSAGPIRNKEMAEYADMLIAFWDGESPGTKNMIEEMKQLNKIIHIIEIPKFVPKTGSNLNKFFGENK